MLTSNNLFDFTINQLDEFITLFGQKSTGNKMIDRHIASQLLDYYNGECSYIDLLQDDFIDSSLLPLLPDNNKASQLISRESKLLAAFPDSIIALFIITAIIEKFGLFNVFTFLITIIINF